MTLTAELGREGRILDGADLSPDALVWIVGAFKGKTARLLYERYRCRIVAFDPQPHAIENLQQLELPASHLKICEFGLLARTGTFPMREVGNDACSFYALEGGRDPGVGVAVDVAEVWAGERVDLALLNCEGGEFEILPRLAAVGALDSFDRLLVQFHTEAAAPIDYRRVKDLVDATHDRVWDRGPSWIYWRRRGL